MTRRTRGINLSENPEEANATISSPASAATGIDLSKLSPESKELFQCITQYFKHLMLEKDTKIKQLEDDVNNLKERIEELQNEVDDSVAYINEKH